MMKNFFPSKPKTDPYGSSSIAGMMASSAKPDPYSYSIAGKPPSTATSFNKTATSLGSKQNKGEEGSKKHVAPKDLVPERFGLSYKPPVILLEYRDPNDDKLYHHKILLKKLTKDINNKDVHDYIRKKHKVYYNAIDEDQLEKLIDKLKSKLPASSASTGGASTYGGGVGGNSKFAVQNSKIAEQEKSSQKDEDDYDDDFDYDYDDEDA